VVAVDIVVDWVLWV